MPKVFNVVIGSYQFDIHPNGNVYSFPYPLGSGVYIVEGLTFRNPLTGVQNLTTFRAFFRWSQLQNYAWSKRQLHFLTSFLHHESDRGLIS